jgi:hypothetical protein
MVTAVRRTVSAKVELINRHLAAIKDEAHPGSILGQVSPVGSRTARLDPLPPAVNGRFGEVDLSLARGHYWDAEFKFFCAE